MPNILAWTSTQIKSFYLSHRKGSKQHFLSLERPYKIQMEIFTILMWQQQGSSLSTHLIRTIKGSFSSRRRGIWCSILRSSKLKARLRLINLRWNLVILVVVGLQMKKKKTLHKNWFKRCSSNTKRITRIVK